MSNALPNKLQKIFEQSVALALPTAVRAGGPVLVNIKREEEDQGQDKRAIFIQQFKKSLSELFLQAAKKTEGKEDAPVKKAASSREEMEERISKFSLMDKDLLEAQILIDRLCNLLQAEHQFEVDCLGMRLERVAGITIERANNPLSAKNITTAYHQACDALQPSKFSSDSAMANWGKALKEAYPQWLKHLNHILIKQHILPRLDMDDVSRRYDEKKSQDKAREMRKNLIADITGADADADVSNAELMQSIKTLVSSAVTDRPELSKHVITGSDSGPLATKEDILEALRGLTKTTQINPDTGYRELPVDEKSLAEKVAAMTDIQSKALDSQTQNSISLLSMMFDKLQNEVQIAEPIKPLINELQAPILKLAVQNQEFFSNPDNPAQELINEITQAGTHWTPKQNINKDPFYKKISAIVDDINTSSDEHEDTESVFEEKLITLKDFLEREKQRSALLEERIIQAESMKARTDAAREAAEKIIHKKIFRYNAEPCTAAFLKDYWTQVLFFYINRDDDTSSDEQQQARQLVDKLLIFTQDTLDTNFDTVFEQLVWHVHHMGLQISDQEQTLINIRSEINSRQQQIKEEIARAAEAATKAEEQAQAAARAAAALSAAVKETLDQQDAPPQATPVPLTIPTTAPASTLPTETPSVRAEPLDITITTPVVHTEPSAIAFEFTKTTETPIPATEDTLDINPELLGTVPVDEDEEDDEVITEDDLALEDIFDKQADMLRADTWFRLTNSTHDNLKIKLAAVIKHNGNYIFVNREGIKIITAKKPEVAELLRHGELTIVDDTVFFDRALESVIQSLRK